MAMSIFALHPTAKGMESCLLLSSFCCIRNITKKTAAMKKDRICVQRGLPQRTVGVAVIFCGLGRTGMLDKDREQNYQNEHQFWLVIKRGES